VVVQVDLGDELAPLIDTVNRPYTWRTRPLQHESYEPVPELPRGEFITHWRRNYITIGVRMNGRGVSGSRPNAKRRQTVWILVQIAQLGRGLSPNAGRPKARERRAGSLRAPMNFTMVMMSDSFGNEGPLWTHHLRITCPTNTNVIAVRRQISLLSEYMANPNNLLPIRFPSMLA